MHSPSLAAETYPDLEALQLQLWGPEAKSRLDSVEREIAKQTAETLKKWNAPVVSVIAALLLPLLSRERRYWPRTEVSDDARDLAQRLADRRAFLVPGQAREGASVAWHYSNLSRMYREAYLDWPDLSFTLLLLAHHDALLVHGPNFSKDDARLTQRVFAPFAEMLGVWSLYRTWLERSYKILFVKEYKDMQELMGPTEVYKEEKFKEILTPAGNKNGDSYKKTNLVDKATAFLDIKPKLQDRFALKKLKAEVVLIENLTGLALRRVREKEAREDVARRLGMRIICESTDDCYAALGIFHSLGRPISLGSVLHFQDHIASPQPNGYQALEAAITYSGYKASGSGSIVIECRILTEEMLRMNDLGVVIARGDTGALTAPETAWWNQIPKLNAQLSGMLDLPQVDDSILTKYLRAHEHGAQSNPIYVFTPRGEILLLPQGSTALDFAYRIHTEMGHHALRIDVNGESVPHGYPLRNGDIVRIHYDPDYAGPDISWLNLVATPAARTSIKRKLAARARTAHEGRAYVEATLLRALNRFQRQKKFNLNITTVRLESFLRERAPVYGYSDVTKLLDQLEDDPNRKKEEADQRNELAQRLVGDLVSSELTASITSAEGEPLCYALDHMKICQTCLPVPGDPIVGYEIVSSSGKKKLNIHVAGQRCVTTVTQERIVKLAWSDESNLDQNELLVFTLTCDDRPRLLYEVLDAIYQTEEAYLYKVEASTFTDQQAVISLVVKADNYDRFAEIHNRLENVAGVHVTSTAPPSPSQQMTLVADPLRLQLPRELPPPRPIPYTSEEVYTRDIFFDRQELLDEILDWLREPAPKDPMILHGQRRVGKTSLVMYLINEYLPAHRLVHAVFVNFQDLSEFSPQNVAGLIVRAVFQEIRQGIPPQEEGEEPMEWLSRALVTARKVYPNLLIVIDEFNVLIDIERESNRKSPVYKNLRGMMRTQREINWLIVVQDTHFYNPYMWGGAGVILQKKRAHAVQHLDRNWSRRLILKPAGRCGVVPEDEGPIIDKVLDLTAGNPLFIHLICRELVERARRQGRGVFTMADLEAAKNAVTYEGDRWFFHFMENLTGVREIVMAAVTDAIRSHGQTDASEVIDLVREKASEITENTIHQNLSSLQQEGLISIQGENEGEPGCIKIPIGLFKEFLFLPDKMNLDKSVAKWRSSLPPGRKRKLLQKKNDQARPVG